MWWPRLPRGSPLPGALAQERIEGHLVVRNIDRVRHRQQPVLVIGCMTSFDRAPFRSLHAGGLGSFLDRQSCELAGFFDTSTEQPAPGLAADSNYIVNVMRFLCSYLITP